MRIALIGLAVAALGGSAHAASSAASAPIAVVPFTGLHADEAQHAVMRALGVRAAIVAEADLAAAKPYAVVRGAVEKRDAQLVLVVRIIGEDGTEKGKLEVIIAKRHLTPEQLTKLAEDVDDQAMKAMNTPPPAPPAPTDASPAEPEHGPPVPQVADAEVAPLTLVAKAPKPKPLPPRRPLLPDVPRPRWYPYVDAQVGAIITGRSLSFDPGHPPYFHGGTAGGIHADVALYPLAFLHAVAGGVLAGLGGWVSLDAPFWPTTQFESSGGSFDTSELRVEGGGRFRLVARRLPPRIEVALFGGVGLHTFTIAKTLDATGHMVDAGPPDSRYTYVIVGASAKANFFRERITAWLSGAYEYVPDAGPTENLDEYGLSNTHGLVFRGGVDVNVWRRIRAGVSGFYERVMLSFENTVPTLRHASSAVDQYYGGIVTLAVDL